MLDNYGVTFSGNGEDLVINRQTVVANQPTLLSLDFGDISYNNGFNRYGKTDIITSHQAESSVITVKVLVPNSTVVDNRVQVTVANQINRIASAPDSKLIINVDNSNTRYCSGCLKNIHVDRLTLGKGEIITVLYEVPSGVLYQDLEILPYSGSVNLASLYNASFTSSAHLKFNATASGQTANVKHYINGALKAEVNITSTSSGVVDFDMASCSVSSGTVVIVIGPSQNRIAHMSTLAVSGTLSLTKLVATVGRYYV